MVFHANAQLILLFSTDPLFALWRGESEFALAATHQQTHSIFAILITLPTHQ